MRILFVMFPVFLLGGTVLAQELEPEDNSVFYRIIDTGPGPATLLVISDDQDRDDDVETEIDMLGVCRS